MVTESFLMSASITAPQLSQMITNQRCFETSATAMVGKHARVVKKIAFQSGRASTYWTNLESHDPLPDWRR